MTRTREMEYDFKEFGRYDVQRDIEKKFGCSMITLTQIGEYTGDCKETVRSMMKGVPCYITGKRLKKFYALDVAKVIEARKIYIV